MPKIFDNLTPETKLQPALAKALTGSVRADYCVGYFNLRGWDQVYPNIGHYSGGPESQIRLLTGMHVEPQAQLRRWLHANTAGQMDNATARRILGELVDSFRKQLTSGAPTVRDYKSLLALKHSILHGLLTVKLFARHPLHAKLYIHVREDTHSPIIPYMGSSNLTFAGLSNQGELNIDVMDQDAAAKLAQWFEDRWNDRFAVEVDEEILRILDLSWVGGPVHPYLVYILMAYHLSDDARRGKFEFTIPAHREIQQMFEFQKVAIQIVAQKIEKMGGCLLADVVGLGKTRIAAAVAATLYARDHRYDTLIVCPPNLVPMWRDYAEKRFELNCRIVPSSQLERELPEKTRAYGLVIVDEAHNFRNHETKGHRILKEYIARSNSKVLLLTATPFNKSSNDLYSQLSLFLADDAPITIRPEQHIEHIGGLQKFAHHHNCEPNCLKAFQHSPHAQDWRELLRLFMVRRTRSFLVEAGYTQFDQEKKRPYLSYNDGSRAYFPSRLPRTVKFTINEHDPNDQYARLYCDETVAAIGNLTLPRYGLGPYIDPAQSTNAQQESDIQRLTRAGRRLLGYVKTNLFKRLESSGQSFLLSVRRHILRNQVLVYAIDNRLDLPIGQFDSGYFDDEDPDDGLGTDYEAVAESAYGVMAQIEYRHRFTWIPSRLFLPSLKSNLLRDINHLESILAAAGPWRPPHDSKLGALRKLLHETHHDQKILLFSEFADTINYLESHLPGDDIVPCTGKTNDPVDCARRFSPVSHSIRSSEVPNPIRVLLATDVLSEGHNLQDAHIIVNYDLPWTLIRLVQRAGRVDRIGQTHPTITAYSFLPADGIDRFLRLRATLLGRIQDNLNIVGGDERFIEDQPDEANPLRDLFNEKDGVLDDQDSPTDVDLGSFALSIYENAIKAHPRLADAVPLVPAVTYGISPQANAGEAVSNSTNNSADSTSASGPGSPVPTHHGSAPRPSSIVFVRTPDHFDHLQLLDPATNSILSENPFTILQYAACSPPADLAQHYERFINPDRQREHTVVLDQWNPSPAGEDELIFLTPQLQAHFEAVEAAEQAIIRSLHEQLKPGALGNPATPRYKAYHLLDRYINAHQRTHQSDLFAGTDLAALQQAIYDRPLTDSAARSIKHKFRQREADLQIIELIRVLYEQEDLILPPGQTAPNEPLILCSLLLN